MNRIAKSVAVRTILASEGWRKIQNSDKESILPAIWEMYEISYRAIGMNIPSASALEQEYDDWWVHYSGDTPNAFRVGKTTRWGVKAGASGTDGSPDGKSSARSMVGKMFHLLGNYGEVSHAIEHFAKAAQVPVVCSVYAEKVLNKPIAPVPDGIHYTRSLAGVGQITKVMVGNPKGVPTTTWDNPTCPLQAG